jgi:hypothetical protein
LTTEFHLLEHRKLFLEYLQAFQLRRQTPLQPLPLKPFHGLAGEVTGEGSTVGYMYDDKSISEDMVGDVYIEYSKRTRQQESDDYVRSLTGVASYFIS